jgi:hypothetical protein
VRRGLGEGCLRVRGGGLGRLGIGKLLVNVEIMTSLIENYRSCVHGLIPIMALHQNNLTSANFAPNLL